MKKYGPMIARILLGFVFAGAGIAAFVMGLNNPPPPGTPESLVTFTTGLRATVYFMPFLKAVEVICGLMLMSGFFVPLALVILAPIVINILLVHAFLAPSGLPLAIILALLEGYLAFGASPYKERICPLFQKK